MPDVGLIGLGVMGKNLVLNLVDHGFTTHVYNRTQSKTKEIEKLNSKILGFDDLGAFVSSLSKPRKILMIIAAGNAVDTILEKLSELLDEDDIVVDCGNSNYKDTIRRFEDCKFNFVGCGVSGGEYGARHGPSIMVGCKEAVYAQIKDVLEPVSAKHNSVPCCRWLGSDGAGHFVKIVHNGIEYCEMQLLQELFNLIPSAETSLTFFNELNKGRCGGYLVEVCEKISKKHNDSGLVLTQILDKAEQKGTGKMCIVAGVEVDADVRFISQAVFSRYLSHAKNKRVKFHKAVEKLKCYKTVWPGTPIEWDSETSAMFEKAFYLAKAICYIQGSNLLALYKDVHKWSYSIADVCDVWRDGCVLRCQFLDVLKEISKDSDLEVSRAFLPILDECLPSLKQICSLSVQNGAYCPLFHDCLAWVYGMNMAEGNGVLLQGMRDYFGRHGVVLNTGEEVNIEWDE